MTPEQMAEMQRLASSMGPAQLAEMQRMAASMPPELVRQGMQQMNNMSPAEQLEALRRGGPSNVQAAMNQAQAQFGADAGYQVGLCLLRWGRSVLSPEVPRVLLTCSHCLHPCVCGER